MVLRLLLLLIGLWAGMLSPAFAWMAGTHVYLAEQALQEAARSGYVTIWQVDARTGRRVRPIGRFEVDRSLLADILAHRGEFHAGLIGPDGYPDIPTGDFAIHQDNQAGGHGGPTSDLWLQELWRRSRTPAERAFVIGFIEHAAGDVCAHEFINYITGGPYEFAHHNAIKHITIESYVARVTPLSTDPHFYDLEIGPIAGFLFNTLIRTPLLSGDGTRLSLPGWIQATRSMPFPLPDDIRRHLDEGLEAWPAISTRMARAMMFNPTRVPDWNEADAAVRDYLAEIDHMLTEEQMLALYEKLKGTMPAGSREDLEWFRQLGRMPRGQMLSIMEKLGEKVPSMKDLAPVLVNAEPEFNAIVAVKDANPDGSPSSYGDHPITLARFRQEVLHMAPSDTTFDYLRFPSAYNTYVMGQLALLDRRGLRRLVEALERITHRPVVAGALPRNALLGFIHTMNGRPQPQRPVFLSSDALYYTIFMHPERP